MKGIMIRLSLLALMLAAVSMSAMAKEARAIAIHAQLTLGENQKGKVLKYTRAEAEDNIYRYDARIDNMPRTVTYAFDGSRKSITVSIDGGSARLQYEVRLSGTEEKPTADYIVSSGGMEVGRAAGTMIGSKVLISLSKNARFDAYSMDVLLHLPSEVTGIRPQDLFGSDAGGDVSAQGLGVGKFLKKLLGLLTSGAKYEHDCSTTKTGTIHSCTAPCEARSDESGGCGCSMCGDICCGGQCTTTEGTETRNCSATVSIGQ